MTDGQIHQGSKVKVKDTGEAGMVVAPSTGGPSKLYHGGDGQMNIAVFSILLENGAVRQYVRASLELAE